jgi:alginate O-acetyltransferase complex protein AlgI
MLAPAAQGSPPRPLVAPRVQPVLFNSYVFIFGFLPAVLAGFFALRSQTLRLVLLVTASYVFYGWSEHWFPLLMVTTTVISFLGGLAVARQSGRGRKVAVLSVGIAGALSLLLYFKYAGFGMYYFSNFVSALGQPGFPSAVQFVRGIVLPIGISFYTFESISYQADVYRGLIEPERNLLRYAFFISFFPHLIAGPIVRYGKLVPQLGRLYRFDPDLFRAGLLLFALGLAKKVLIADGIAFRIDVPLNHPTDFGFFDAWTTMFAYGFQIYFDFSGYTDMALGLAMLFGIVLPWNFDRPYRATSPREFWRRWHVTLSTWLRDYLYVPLGGNRKGKTRRDVNLLATMGLGGLWHGAQLSFVEWGLYHGGLLVGQHRLERLRIRIPGPVAIATTFVLVTIGWVFFRLRVRSDISAMLGAMAGTDGRGHVVWPLVPYLVVAGVLMWAVPEERNWGLERFGFGRLTCVAVITAVAIISLNQTQQFLYFKF